MLIVNVIEFDASCQFEESLCIHYFYPIVHVIHLFHKFYLPWSDVHWNKAVEFSFLTEFSASHILKKSVSLCYFYPTVHNTSVRSTFLFCFVLVLI